MRRIALALVLTLLGVAPSPSPSPTVQPSPLSATNGFDVTLKSDAPAASGTYHCSFELIVIVNDITIKNAWVCSKL